MTSFVSGVLLGLPIGVFGYVIARVAIWAAKREQDPYRQVFNASTGFWDFEYRFVRPDGTASEHDPHNDHCDCVFERRVVYEGDWVRGDPGPGTGR